MTPKRRANICYYGAIASLGLGMLLFVVGRSTSTRLATMAGGVLIGLYLVAGVYGLATSRCPHCRRFIDLRGPSSYCMRCGRWLPAHEGDPPARLP